MNWNSPEFKALQTKWYGKLKKTGFNDVEKPDGSLKDVKDTAGSRDRENVFDFFYRLDHYLTNNEIPKRDRKIMELYSQGKHIEGKGGIAKTLRLSEIMIYRTIRKYKEILIGKPTVKGLK